MRNWTLSAVLLTAATAFGQPPKTDPKVPPKIPSTTEPVTDAEALLKTLREEKPPAPGSLDEALLQALRQHPDIKLADAKVRLAEAEAEQVRSQVALRVAAAFAKLEQAKAELLPAKEKHDRIREIGGVAKTEVLEAAAQYQKAKSAVVAAEVELNTAKGVAPRVVPNYDPNQAAIDAGLKWLARSQELGIAPVKPVPAGTVADKVKGLLDKPVTLDLSGADLDEAVAAVLKSVGDTTLTVKTPTIGKRYLKNPPTATLKGEFPFTAAVQLILDEINDPAKMDGVFETLRGKYDVYVREYGLLIARVQDAPKDAPTLTEFVRQVRAEKGGKK